MELNNYQKQVMRDLSAYLNCVNESANLPSAWRKYWFDKDVAVGMDGVPRYNDSIEAVPPYLHEGAHRRRQDLYGVRVSQAHF